MVTIKAKIIDPTGLHARPASILTMTATKYRSEIKIIAGEQAGNLKSILSVLSLGAKKDEIIEISINGIDEQEARQGLINQIESLKIGLII